MDSHWGSKSCPSLCQSLRKTSSMLERRQHLLPCRQRRTLESERPPYLKSSRDITQCIENPLTLMVVPGYKKCPASRRCLRQRRIFQHPPCSPDHRHPVASGEKSWWRDFRNAFFRNFHQYTDPLYLLVRCFIHLTTEERKGAISRPTRRALLALPRRKRQGKVLWQKQDTNGDIP